MLLVKESTTTSNIDQEELSYELDQMQFWLDQYRLDLASAEKSLELFKRHQAYAKEIAYATKS